MCLRKKTDVYLELCPGSVYGVSRFNKYHDVNTLPKAVLNVTDSIVPWIQNSIGNILVLLVTVRFMLLAGFVKCVVVIQSTNQSKVCPYPTFPHKLNSGPSLVGGV